MVVLRRRSGTKAGDDKSAARDQIASSTTTTTLILTVALVATLVFTALYLASRILPGSLPIGIHTSHEASVHDDFRLGPERHALRNATTWRHHWRITAGLQRPDGVLKRVYLINDAFPGPTVEARSGDHLIISVENVLPDEETVSIHFHGLTMRGANNMDGVAGLTQAPIKAGSTFVYNFTVESTQHGTFWYHSHDALQRADGLYGGLIVHEPVISRSSRELDDEYLLLVGDWYHRSAQEALDFYMHPGAFGLETVPDSLLVNGVGSYQCSNAVPARPVDCIERFLHEFLDLKSDAGKRTVLRVVNTGAYAGFKVAITGAQLTAIRVDGGCPIHGSPTKAVGFLYAGERMDILVETVSNPSHDRDTLQIQMDDTKFKYENTALDIVHRFPVHGLSHIAKVNTATHPVFELFDIQDAKPAKAQDSILPPAADHTVLLYTITQKLARLENEPHGFINHSTWPSQSLQALMHIPKHDLEDNYLIPDIEYNVNSPLWVDIVLNNLDEDSHPFHMHGHDFWVLSKYSSDINWGSYNPFVDTSAPGGDYNLAAAVKKDTIYVPRRGYAVLRFRADNPGLWLFHCHVLWHQASGMAMAFDIGRKGR